VTRTLPHETKRNQWVHLLWAEPLALPFAAVAWMWAAISRCGVSGCRGGGFGVSRDTVASAVGFTVSGLFLALPICHGALGAARNPVLGRGRHRRVVVLLLVDWKRHTLRPSRPRLADLAQFMGEGASGPPQRELNAHLLQSMNRSARRAQAHLESSCYESAAYQDALLLVHGWA
jgi:hypothetical protein